LTAQRADRTAGVFVPAAVGSLREDDGGLIAITPTLDGTNNY
jgi:hypothetical protein